jgi:hypothetical protein
MEPPDVRQAAERILEASWAAERRRAWWRLIGRTLGRVTVFVGALALLGLAVCRAAMPWPFFAFFAVLGLACALPRGGEVHHLRRAERLGSGQPGG